MLKFVVGTSSPVLPVIGWKMCNFGSDQGNFWVWVSYLNFGMYIFWSKICSVKTLRNRLCLSGKTWCKSKYMNVSMRSGGLGNLRSKRGILPIHWSLDFGRKNEIFWVLILSIFSSLKAVLKSSQNGQILPSIYLVKSFWCVNSQIIYFSAINKVKYWKLIW